MSTLALIADSLDGLTVVVSSSRLPRAPAATAAFSRPGLRCCDDCAASRAA